MRQEPDFKQYELPDRKEITLCEAVTAFALGKAMDVLDFDLDRLDGKSMTKEQNLKIRVFIQRLQNAAYAEHLTFRAHKTGDEEANTHRVIDNLYFSQPRGFR
jgi:hypothetical protein